MSFKIFLSRFIIIVFSSGRAVWCPWSMWRRKQYHADNSTAKTVHSNSRTKNDLFKAKFSDKSKNKPKHCVIYFIVGFWEKTGTVYILLPESFNLLRFLVFVQFCVESKKPISGNLFAVTCPLETMPFHLLAVEISMVISFPSQKLCISSHLMQTIHCPLVLTYFILLFFCSVSLT